MIYLIIFKFRPISVWFSLNKSCSLAEMRRVEGWVWIKKLPAGSAGWVVESIKSSQLRKGVVEKQFTEDGMSTAYTK
jgi:hypothetical protein